MSLLGSIGSSRPIAHPGSALAYLTPSALRPSACAHVDELLSAPLKDGRINAFLEGCGTYCNYTSFPLMNPQSPLKSQVRQIIAARKSLAKIERRIERQRKVIAKLKHGQDCSEVAQVLQQLVESHRQIQGNTQQLTESLQLQFLRTDA